MSKVLVPTYLYCLVKAADEPPPALRGMGEAPVRVVEEGALRAWVSTVETRVVAPSVARARVHDGVVRAALALGTPVPARFGQTFADEQSLLASLRERAESIAAMLRRVDGCVEMTVHLTLPPAGGPAAEDRSETGPGRAYLDGLAQREREASAALRRAGFLQERIAHAAKDLIRESSPATYTPSTHAVSLSHLIAREAVPSYRHVLHGLAEGGDAPQRAVISGPWAPYSFVELRHD